MTVKTLQQVNFDRTTGTEQQRQNNVERTTEQLQDSQNRKVRIDRTVRTGQRVPVCLEGQPEPANLKGQSKWISLCRYDKGGQERSDRPAGKVQS
jgi:hypothetical protein